MTGKHDRREGGAAGGSSVGSGGSGGAVSFRPLRIEDARRGFLETLDALRPASNTPDEALRAMDIIISDKNRLVAVAETQGGQIVGTATILFEQKAIHGGGVAGHIEDVAVRRGFQGAGIGNGLVRYLLDAAEERGCYKTILDCEDGLVQYYEGRGFRRASNCMRYDHKKGGGQGAA